VSTFRVIVLNQRVLLALIAAAGVLTLSWGAARAEAATGQASVTIATDTGTNALFSSRRMRPAVPESACLTVSTTDTRAGDTVRITALDVTGQLAGSLRIAVDMGSGGGGGSCVGFLGSQVFAGTLSQLAASSVNDGVVIGWSPVATPSQSFRITVTVPDDPGLQGLTAGGRFTWLVLTDPNAPTPTPTPTAPTPPTTPPAPIASPMPSVSVEIPIGSPTPPPTGSPTAVATSATPTSGTVERSSTPAPTTRATRPPRSRDSAVWAGPLIPPDRPTPGTDVVIEPSLPLTLTRTIVALGEDPQYPIAAMIVVLAFLLVQHGIDVGDPKLAVASVTQRDNELQFEDPFGTPDAPAARRRGVRFS
jgi:hypothetical protein